jgi:nucleoside-diphosphate-sugar epimerase
VPHSARPVGIAGEKALVTGAGGFLGGAIARLLRQGGACVRSFNRTAYPWLEQIGVEQHVGDVADATAVGKAAAGVDVVYHVAAKAGVWGRYQDFVATNVVGTENVIAACLKTGTRRLVYTSTPSVVHDGRDLEGVNESVPYPKRFEADYAATKARAEQAVLAANGPELSTVALRPHLIWGPGDPHLIPRILVRGRDGTLRRIGSRPVRVDVTYVDNAADAHVLAGERLAVDSLCAGKAYFVSNGEPVELWAFINRVLATAGLPPVIRAVPRRTTMLTGVLLERLYRLLRVANEPPMTRFVAAQLSTSHWYDISAARRDLGYEPRVSIDEGLRRLAESFDTTGQRDRQVTTPGPTSDN